MKIKKLNFNIIALFLVALFITANLFAQEDSDFTKEELVTRLAGLLTYNMEVLSYIPELKSQEDEKGDIFFTYVTEHGVTKKLNELDKDILVKLLGRVNGEVNRLNTERIMRQLEQVRQAQQVPKTPPQPPQPPRIVVPPEAPTPPQPPPQPPKVYTPPEQPKS